MNANPKKYGWHFVGETLRDGRPVPPNGAWLEHYGPVDICKSGLHYSAEPFDALAYAPGKKLCYVESDGVVDMQLDKIVCRRRKIVKRMDATEMLRYFARMQALSVIDNWKRAPPDIVLDWLMTGDEAIRSAAYLAARSAADSAAYSAAYSAAHSAVHSAAQAAYLAADSAAYSAAYSAAHSEAYSAAYSAARQDFNTLVYECFGLER